MKAGAGTGCSQPYLVPADWSGLDKYCAIFLRAELILTALGSAHCVLASFHLPPPRLPILGAHCTPGGRLVEGCSSVCMINIACQAFRHWGRGESML